MSWFVVLLAIGLMITMFLFLYRDLVLEGKPWTGGRVKFAYVSLAIPLLAAICIWLLAIIKLKIVVDEEGVLFRMFPLIWKAERIERQNISEFVIRRVEFWEYMQSGGERRRHLKGRKRIHIINSRKVVDIKLHDGGQIILGTTNPDGFERAMRRLLSPTA